jgi:hypothetical protein
VADLEGRVIRAVDLTAPSFRNGFKAIKDASLREEILSTLRALLGQNIDTAPRKWHMHPLTGRDVVSRLDPMKKVAAWSLHVTADDVYKASFTYEDGGAYFRNLDTHQVIDKRP